MYDKLTPVGSVWNISRADEPGKARGSGMGRRYLTPEGVRGSISLHSGRSRRLNLDAASTTTPRDRVMRSRRRRPRVRRVSAHISPPTVRARAAAVGVTCDYLAK
ncbi:hypothetical protein WOLCODRAFT_167635 [Wolfiporia cocos MD-104 SS10]|uniref:Uncharacterized protein n=1 Tax=Wolfiporia cocos (strain MD-104) TaxID=742152 RepID=A0A2H3JB47_WOLCO|nr:hypothetical protein WOLCODRAFT_167635 [Wolfiporia cocos MD-104 SS10]